MSLPRHLYSIDLIRCLSALAIVIIHVFGAVFNLYHQISPTAWTISLFVESFFRWGTPLFIMISGYLLLNSSTVTHPKIFYSRRAKRLFLPIVFWSVFYYYLNIYTGSGSASFTDFISQMWHANTYYHLYFLFLISGLYFISPFIKYLIDHHLNLNFLVPFLVIFSNVYLVGSIWFHWPKFDTVTTWFFLYIGYYLAGYWLSQKHFIVRPWHWLSLLLPLIGSVVDIYFIRYFGIGDRGTFLTHRLSLLVALPAFVIFTYLINLDNHSFSRLKLHRLTGFADLSMGVYLVHPALISLLSRISFFSALLQTSPIFWSLITLVLVVTLSLGLISLLKRLPLLSKIV